MSFEESPVNVAACMVDNSIVVCHDECHVLGNVGL